MSGRRLVATEHVVIEGKRGCVPVYAVSTFWATLSREERSDWIRTEIAAGIKMLRERRWKPLKTWDNERAFS